MSFAAMKLYVTSQWMLIFVSVEYDLRSALTFVSESGKQKYSSGFTVTTQKQKQQHSQWEKTTL